MVICVYLERSDKNLLLKFVESPWRILTLVVEKSYKHLKNDSYKSIVKKLLILIGNNQLKLNEE